MGLSLSGSRAGCFVGLSVSGSRGGFLEGLSDCSDGVSDVCSAEELAVGFEAVLDFAD